MIWQDIYTTLHGNSSVANTVGTSIYPNIIDQDASAPYIVTMQVSNTDPAAVSGAIGLRNCSYQIDCYASTLSAAKTLASNVKTAMNSASLFKAVLQNEIDFFEFDLTLHRVMVEFSIWA